MPRRTPISLDLASAVAALSGQSNGKGPCLSKTNGANENNETHKGGNEADTKKLTFEEVLLGRNYPEIFYHIHRLYFNHANVKWNNCGGYLAQNKSTKENPLLLNDFFIDYRNIVGKFSRKFRNINPLYFVDPYGLSIVWLSFIRCTLGVLQESMEVITTYLTERHYVNYVNTKSEKKKQGEGRSLKYPRIKWTWKLIQGYGANTQISNMPLLLNHYMKLSTQVYTLQSTFSRQSKNSTLLLLLTSWNKI